MNIFKSLIYLGLIVTAMFISGCGSTMNLVKSGIYGLEEASPSGITFSHVTAYNDNENFVVAGKLKRKNVHRSFPGHVDIAIVTSNGDIFATTSVKNKLPFIGRSKRKTSSFKAKFVTAPPDGSEIRVSFHRKGVSEYNQFKCNSNQAI